MSTAPIQMSNIILSESGAKPGLLETADSSSKFNEVLSREMNERQATSKDKQDTETQDAKAAASDSAKVAEKANAAQEKKTPQDGESEKVSEETADTRQILAFVAQLGEAGNSVEIETPADSFPASQSGAQSALVSTGEMRKVIHEAGAEFAEISEEALLKQDASSSAQIKAEESTDDILQQTSVANAIAGNKLLGQAEKSALTGASVPDATTTLPESLAITNPFQQSAIGNNPFVNQGASPMTHLAPEVATPAWNQALGQQVVWMVSGEVQTASLNLTPPELGPLQITLNVSNNQASANFVAAQPEVRQALEDAMPRLRQMLGEAGIELGNTSVSAGTPQQQGFEGESGSNPRHSNGVAMLESGMTAAESVEVVPARRRGLVDTFV